ncbi:MAG: hypothetical protein JWO03_288 [Bacteroidetes bacterium]|nr:hypothetical protein [Bacteroidota bacterium]
MKRIPFILIAITALAAIIVMSSFKDPVKRYLVKEESFVNKGKVTATIRYTYDQQGRLLTTADDTFVMKLVYRGDTVYQSGRYRGTGYISTVFRLGPEKVVVSDNTGKLFMYNTDGFMTAVIYANGNFQSNTIEDGNMTYSSTVMSNRRNSTHCVFYPDLDLRNLGQEIFGRRDMHLIKTLISSDGVNNDTMRYTHMLDEKGRVISETYTGPGPSDTTTIVCKYY